MYVTGVFSFVFSILGDETKRKLYVGQSHFSPFYQKEKYTFYDIKKRRERVRKHNRMRCFFRGPCLYKPALTS